LGDGPVSEIPALKASGRLLTLYAAALSAASFVVILQGAADEPYYRFKPYDCLVQVGGGVTLLVLWAQVALVVVLGTASSRLSRWFLIVLPWAALVCFYLYASPAGYISDMVHHGWEFR
jgi:hypothetical protein